jgi:hypothetical protein
MRMLLVSSRLLGAPRVRPLRSVRAASRRSVRRSAAATGVLAVVGQLALPAGAGVAAIAHSARTISLNETAHLRLTSKHVFTLNEQGAASGTITGAIYIHLHIANSRGEVTAEVNIYPRDGSLSGSGSASYEVQGADAAFSGELSIARGTGSFAGAHAADLRFTGEIQRRTDAVTAHLSGPLSVRS